jgi:hypothetical protein
VPNQYGASQEDRAVKQQQTIAKLDDGAIELHRIYPISHLHPIKKTFPWFVGFFVISGVILALNLGVSSAFEDFDHSLTLRGSLLAMLLL